MSLQLAAREPKMVPLLWPTRFRPGISEGAVTSWTLWAQVGATMGMLRKKCQREALRGGSLGDWVGKCRPGVQCEFQRWKHAMMKVAKGYYSFIMFEHRCF